MSVKSLPLQEKNSQRFEFILLFDSLIKSFKLFTVRMLLGELNLLNFRDKKPEFVKKYCFLLQNLFGINFEVFDENSRNLCDLHTSSLDMKAIRVNTNLYIFSRCKFLRDGF